MYSRESRRRVVGWGAHAEAILSFYSLSYFFLGGGGELVKAGGIFSMKAIYVQ